MTTNSRLTTWKRNSHLQRNYSRWSPWILYFHATRARNPSLKLTLCIAATHLTKTRLSRQNSGRNLHHASPRKDVRTNLMFALLKNPVWNFISRSVPRNRRTERAPCLFCARLSIQSQYWKRPPHGKLTHAQLLCMENEGSYHWPKVGLNFLLTCPNGTDDPHIDTRILFFLQGLVLSANARNLSPER